MLQKAWTTRASTAPMRSTLIYPISRIQIEKKEKYSSRQRKTKATKSVDDLYTSTIISKSRKSVTNPACISRRQGKRSYYGYYDVITGVMISLVVWASLGTWCLVFATHNVCSSLSVITETLPASCNFRVTWCNFRVFQLTYGLAKRGWIYR